jgi:hypothetical protein
LQEESKPALHHLRNVAENVDYMSTAIRQDVDRLKLSLAATQERLERVSAETDRRVREFNAFIGVVQEEAEHLFIDTASTLRGVRAGADTLQSQRRPDAGSPEVRRVPRAE